MIKYVIYKLSYPEHLQSKEMDGYYLKTINRAVLETLDVDHVKDEHDTMESALAEIEAHKKDLVGLSLTVLPYINTSFTWD
jgi:hypothetical protein